MVSNVFHRCVCHCTCIENKMISEVFIVVDVIVLLYV